MNRIPFLEVQNDYYVKYGDDYFDLHKSKDIRCLMFLLNKEHGYTELECEYNKEGIDYDSF